MVVVLSKDNKYSTTSEIRTDGQKKGGYFMLSFKSKVERNYHHFKTRLLERYGLEIDSRKYKYLIQKCQQSVNLCQDMRLTKTRSGIGLLYKGQQILVIFDKVRKSLVTALPKGKVLKGTCYTG